MIDFSPIDEFMQSCVRKDGNCNTHRLKTHMPKECADIIRENNLTNHQLFYMWKHGLTEFPICPVCGKRVNDIRLTFCSTKCMANAPDIKSKKISTNIKRYGCVNVFQNDAIKEKSKETCRKNFGTDYFSQCDRHQEIMKEIALERYGVENFLQSDEIKERVKQTCLDRYGVEHPLQYKEFLDKAKNTMLERYGVEHISQTAEFKEKYKNTCLNRYGVEHPLQSDEIKEKFKQTCLEKYGVEYPSQSDEIKEKFKATCLDRYGLEYPSQSDEIKEKIKESWVEKSKPFLNEVLNEETNEKEYVLVTEKDIINEKRKETVRKIYGVDYVSQLDSSKLKHKKTCLEKYGVECTSQLDEVKEKVKKTCLDRYGFETYTKTNEYQERIKKISQEKYGCDHYFQSNEFLKKNFTIRRKNRYKPFLEELKNSNYTMLSTEEEFYNEKELTFKHSCGKVFTSKLANMNALYCPVCSKKKCISEKEKNLLNYVQEIYSDEILENNRKVMQNGKELDIYIPEKKLAIEFNGNYWHSDLFVDEFYHQEKTLDCHKFGIRLIHVYEHEWDNKNALIKSIIRSALGIYEQEVDINQCSVRDISKKVYNDFLKDFSLKYIIKSSVRKGLFYNENLISVAGFSSSNCKVMTTYCENPSYKIYNGLSKIIDDSNLNDVLCLLDLDHYDCFSLLEDDRFSFEGIEEPSYKLTKGLHVFESEDEIDCDKIYDCGNFKLKYIKN